MKRQKIAVIGAGIIGASVAHELHQSGADVTVVDMAGPGGVATANSFGWINASFAESDAYFDLRLAAIDAFKALPMDLSAQVQWNRVPVVGRCGG